GKVDDPNSADILAQVLQPGDPFALLELTDLGGHTLAANPASQKIDINGQEWLTRAQAGPILLPPEQQDGQIRWMVARPVLDGIGGPSGILVGSLKLGAMSTVLRDPDADTTVPRKLLVVDGNHRLIYSSDLGQGSDDRALLAAGVLRTQVLSQAVDHALSSQ